MHPSEYVANGRVTEFGFSHRLSTAVRSGELSNLHQLTDGLLPSASALAFIDNHDSQRSAAMLADAYTVHTRRGLSPNASAYLSYLSYLSSVLTYKEGELYALASAFLLAWPYGRPRLMSSYYFTDHDAGPPSSLVHGGSKPACGPGAPWVCEHRWAVIAAMVGWRDAAGSSDVTNWFADGSGRIAFSRGSRAFIAIAIPNSGVWSASLQTGLPAGTYCDVAVGGMAIEGNTSLRSACASPITVGSDGQSQISVGASGIHVVALHVGALAGRVTEGHLPA